MQDEARRRELADFLRTRRHRSSPLDLGLPNGLRRRTPGLKREEVASAAGISVTLYTWLEQARDIRVSERVLNDLSRALRLTPAEIAQVYELALGRPPPERQTRRDEVSRTVWDMLAAMPGAPAIAYNLRWDVLAWNDAARAFFLDYETVRGLERNILWYTFLNPRVKALFSDWEPAAQAVVGRFRSDYSRNAGDPEFVDLVDRLSAKSAEFVAWWRLHDVLPLLRDRSVDYQHARGGALSLRVVHLSLVGEPGLKISTFLPADDDHSAKRLKRIIADFKKGA